MAPQEIDWDRLDKQRFFVLGAGIFSGLTTALYPLTVIKTRAMALDGPGGLSGAWRSARALVASDGPRGLYKGFGTVVAGLVPTRMLYLGTLEASRSAAARALERHTALPETARAGAASLAAGAVASLTGQLIMVPVDVVSQRLMVMGRAEAARRGVGSGLALARRIVAAEGVAGLYRGLGASVATFVPSSAIWWSSYAAWQAAIWHQLERRGRPDGRLGAGLGAAGASGFAGAPRPRARPPPGEGEVLGVQVAAGLLTGVTSGLLTTPLDVVKTRVQTREAGAPGGGSWAAVARRLAAEEGARGFFRGAGPRCASTAIWGTSMVTAYEFLKRQCALPAED